MKQPLSATVNLDWNLGRKINKADTVGEQSGKSKYGLYVKRHIE